MAASQRRLLSDSPFSWSAWRSCLRTYSSSVDSQCYNNNNNNKLPLLKSSQNAQPASVVQDSNAKPKLSRRTATRSQTRPVCNKGSHSLTCHPHTDHSLSAPGRKATALWPVPSYTAWWQRNIGVRNLPRVFTPWCPAETRTRDL